MSDIDRMIETTLSEEDRAFQARLAREPGYLGQIGGLMSGPLGWVNQLIMVVQALMFVAGVWCAWNFFQATDTLVALQWGLPAMTLLIVGALLKVATLWPSLQANRILREVKRLELQIAKAQ